MGGQWGRKRQVECRCQIIKYRVREGDGRNVARPGEGTKAGEKSGRSSEERMRKEMEYERRL